ELFRNARAQIVNQNVGVLRKPFELRQTRWRFEINDDRLFAAVEYMEIERGAIVKGSAHVTRIIANPGALKFDHLGAQVCENRAGKRPGEHLPQLQHANAIKYLIHFYHQFVSW